MEVRWTRRAVTDLARLHEFQARKSKPSADRIAQALVGAPRKLLENPRIGMRIEEFNPREVRKVLVGPYELRYEIVGQAVFILRLWHTREER